MRPTSFKEASLVVQTEQGTSAAQDPPIHPPFLPSFKNTHPHTHTHKCFTWQAPCAFGESKRGTSTWPIPPKSPPLTHTHTHTHTRLTWQAPCTFGEGEQERHTATHTRTHACLTWQAPCASWEAPPAIPHSTKQGLHHHH